MASETISKNDLQSILSSVLPPDPTKFIEIKGAIWRGACSSNLTDTRVWHGMSAFDGYSYSHVIPDPSYFEGDPNGLITLKEGYYFAFALAHFNTSASSKPVALRIFNYTQNTEVDYPAYMATPVTYETFTNATIVYANAGDIIIPQFQKYADDTSTGYRPSSARFVMIKLT